MREKKKKKKLKFRRGLVKWHRRITSDGGFDCIDVVNTYAPSNPAVGACPWSGQSWRGLKFLFPILILY